jgi:predicted GTPase
LDEEENELPYIERIIAESDCIILVVDSKAGMNSKDEEMLSMVRRAGKISQTILFLNKIDTKPNANKMALITSEYAQYGLDVIATGSAHHGKIEELLLAIYTILKGDIDELDEEEFEEENYIVGDEYPIFEEENEDDDNNDEAGEELSEEDFDESDEDETIGQQELEYNTSAIKVAIV